VGGEALCKIRLSTVAAGDCGRYDHPDGGLDAVPWHGTRKNAYEMAAAMVLPMIPFLCLVWFGVKGACAGLLRNDDRGDAGADALPAEYSMQM